MPVFDEVEFVFNSVTKPRPRGYKTFVMLNSTEHEIFPVGILTSMSGKNSILGLSEPKKCQIS